MTDVVLLRKKIDESGFRLQYIADQLGITYAGLANKLKNGTEFKASEIQKLCDLLHLTMEEREKIFFAKIVDNLSTED